MANEEKNEIGMEFVDPKPVPAQEEPKAEVKEKKPNIFVRAWRGTKSLARKVRESPAAAAVGAVVGVAGTIGVKVLVNHFLHQDDLVSDGDGDEEPIEVEDSTEVYDSETVGIDE